MKVTVTAGDGPTGAGIALTVVVVIARSGAAFEQQQPLAVGLAGRRQGAEGNAWEMVEK